MATVNRLLPDDVVNLTVPSGHILIHNSPRSGLAHELKADRTVHDAPQSEPDGLDARIAVALACEESAEHGDQAQDLIERGWVSRRLLFVEEIGDLPFILGGRTNRRASRDKCGRIASAWQCARKRSPEFDTFRAPSA